MAKKKKVTRGLSKIIVPLDYNGHKEYTQAFRCDAQLKKRLDREDNKSDTIQKALSEYFAKEVMVCPTCKGKGQIRASRKRL